MRSVRSGSFDTFVWSIITYLRDESSGIKINVFVDRILKIGGKIKMFVSQNRSQAAIFSRLIDNGKYFVTDACTFHLMRNYLRKLTRCTAHNIGIVG